MTSHVVKRIRAGIAAVALTFAAVPLATAQEFTDTHIAAARSAMDAINATDPYDNILLSAAEQLKARLIANNLDLEGEITQTVDEQALALVARRGDLELEAARIYAAAFTEEELKAISEFYATEAGKKLLQNGPIVAREVANAAAIWRRGIERDLLENVTKALNEAGLREPAPAPASPATPAEGADDAATQD
ncbi:DUF2059 domain-containing protein [Oricola thermophila]|uniref:DUF2059 domain-containing protein n=1 Tax=Oricola thermophila TaxID=2742145 RepID=A0A6N1VDF8_9HYPH|nr:DUF2059 domain-containing protein [Oricola thermophila]QKV17655.1 DUF2059 domain-containing protein [Oricola thermophila]